MAMSTTITNNRRFIVKGQITCSFTPETIDFTEEIPNLEVELWQKSPLSVFFLGKGSTDESGSFIISCDVKDDVAYLLKGGTIEHVFAKVYYQGNLISGENPYVDEEIPSNRPIKNITLKEGLTDIGTYTIEVTRFEYPADTSNVKILEQITDLSGTILFDIREASSGQLIPVGYTCRFRGFIGKAPSEYTLFSAVSETAKEGYAELSLSPFPIAIKKSGQEFVLNLVVNGIPDSLSDQCYLRLDDGSSGYYYTPVTDLVINNGQLGVYSGDSYYSLTGFSSGLEEVTTVGVDSSGVLALYNADYNTWSFSYYLTFYQFQFPENLLEISAGIYAPTGSSGTIVSGRLGSESFSSFSLSMQNQGFFPMNIEMTVELGKTIIYQDILTDLLPGNKNAVMVETNDFLYPKDKTPDLEEIETISGVTFSTAFTDFLYNQKLNTLNRLKKAGPIRFIEHFPTTGVTEQEVELLQAHVDLYTINENAEQNQYLINQGFDNLYKIAQTPKDDFVNSVESLQLPLYSAASIHNTIGQNQKLLTNLLSEKMKDCELESPFIPDVAGSTFADTAFSKFVNRCQCEDCTSAVSPFSYLVDLVKYGAKHIKKMGTPSYKPINYTAFLTLLENYFFQPFGSFVVDCSTLHKEYCRMRLVTEILEQYVAAKTLPPEVALRLENDRKNFILLTYKTILTQAGTSYEEVRSVASLKDTVQKETAAQKLSDKLGVPLYVPGTQHLTAERIWLTFDNPDTDQRLNAENLESLFGFRDTQRDILTKPDESLMSEWKENFLFDLWKNTDFLSSAYSREGVNESDDDTFKEEWKPIIDPDSFGRSDMTYHSSDFTLALWRHRKADTDDFLSFFVTDPAILSRTSADLAGRKLRIPGQNLSGINFHNNEVYIQNPSSSLFEAFEIFTKETAGAATDITLTQSVPGPPALIKPVMFQPQGEHPVMQYDSVLDVVSPVLSLSPIKITLDWSHAVIVNYLDVSSGGFVQMVSTGAPSEIITSDAGISEIVISPELNHVALTLDTEPSQEFLNGNISFIYRAEVVLDTTTIPDPEKICDELFGTTFEYSYLSPAPAGMDDPLTYKVWDAPPRWPSGIPTSASFFVKLKKLYEIINSGTTEEVYLSIVTDNLHTDMYDFNLLMENLISCEQYLNSMYTYDKPDVEKCYQLASVLRNGARKKLNKYWVQEEIKHIPVGGTVPEKLMLQNRLFWKSLNEPQPGVWDSSLQTIPATTAEITVADVPIIDPERMDRQRLLTSPDAKCYVNLYDARHQQLGNQREVYFSWLVPFDVNGFVYILNHINTGDKDTPYEISPYATMKELISDFESLDIFLQLKAGTVLEEAFSLTADAFSRMLPVMNAYQDGNPSNQPAISELRMVTDLLVSAYKKKRLYFTIAPETGWIEQEVSGNFPDGIAVKYYNVLKMRLDSVRGSITDRSEWQHTLAAWNRIPVIFPDIVPPENIKQFVQGEIVHDLWIERKDALDVSYDEAASIFNATLPVEDLYQAIKSFINVLISRSELPLFNDDYLYFTELFNKEEEGEDIRPFLAQLNIQLTEYRVLKQVYILLENEYDDDPLQLSNLLPSEYQDVINIFIQVNTANQTYFQYVQQEYTENIILNGNDFRNYVPALINFPLDTIQETTQWRSPVAAKKAWKDTLNTRIESRQRAQDEWETVLEQAEDISMPVMRDALIRSQQKGCESFEDTADLLRQILFIETKDNCCVKHSRISHAIETLQGFYFSLKTGISNSTSYLEDFILTAPDFDKEWQWLGSYGTWRSAVFTYIYPENLLYPTLKRRQSPAFIELAETIQNANRFTALNTCQAAKKYQEYFEDIQNLQLVCTANARAYVFRKDPLDCCGDLNNSIEEYTSYYFAQSKRNQKAYYSEKPFYAASADEHDFWKEVPLRDNVKIIGCLPLYRKDYAISSALWLFYTYKDNGGVKLAYLKKDLSTAGSSWSEAEDIELPELTEVTYTTTAEIVPGQSILPVPVLNSLAYSTATPLVNTTDELIDITICQHSEEWDFVHFIFSYRRLNGNMRHIQVRYMAQDDFFDKAIGSILCFDNASLPVTAIRHQVSTSTANLPELIGITVLFENELQSGVYGNLSGLNPVAPVKVRFSKLIGAFKKAHSTTAFFIAGKVSTRETNYSAVHVTYLQNNAGEIVLSVHREAMTVSSFERNIVSLAPRYNFSSWDSANAVTVYNDTMLAGVQFTQPSGSLNLSGENIFSLAPEKRVAVAIESGECIDNYDLRTANIKEHLKANLNAPQGSPIGRYYRTSTVKEVLYEAYYFVPMLLALDQQQRGDYPTALNWFRSVYDYTNDIRTKRKVFYGLVLEQNIANAFNRPADWLLDPLNPHLVAQTRTNAYTKYTLMNIIQCMLAYGDREFTIDTIETVPNARKLYSEALELLKVNELNVKPSQCYTKARNCFPGAVTVPVDEYWSNSFEELQHKLQRLNDVPLIENTSDELVAILNGEGTLQTKFSDAFTYMARFKAFRAAEVPNSVAELIDTTGDRMNDAYRYLFAELDTTTFNQTVQTHFTNTLGRIVSLPPHDVILPENKEKINWLTYPEMDNATPLVFRFITNQGVQLLGNNEAFNPIRPTPLTLQANLVFTNASVFYTPFLYEENYTPSIDYTFCLPSNPVYTSLELKANLELFKIHNCRNIAGVERPLDIYAAPTDGTTGVPLIGAGGNLMLPVAGAITPSPYRFRVLIERAKQLVSQAQQLESQFLSALEKEDAENYNQLRARQDLQTAKASVKLQDMRVKQSENEKTVADLQLDKMQFVQNTYKNWIASGLNGYENASMSLLIASAALGSSASAFMLTNVAGALQTLAEATASISNVMSQLASYARREQEWQYQSDLAGYDISIANQQIKIAEQNTRIVSQEREVASLNMGHATDTLEFLKTKFTNAELYRWMGTVLERTYNYMLSLATATAKTAERQYYFEQQQQAGPFILDDYWEMTQTGSFSGNGPDRRGLTGSARLLQDITKLDQYAFDNTKRKLQMTKVISLGQLYPDAFQAFRETGVLNFDLADRLFGYDFPGHYLRLITGVKISVVGLLPVYDSIKASLTAATTSYTVINANNTFQRIPIRRMETEQVALTAASRATGIFEFQPAQSELLNPFEGMGIESRWEFKMPRFSNRMDYSTIADVLIEVDYTAMESFQYRLQVLQDIDNTLGFSRGFSFRNDYPDQWYELAEAQEGGSEFSVEIELKRDQFPQGIDAIRLDGSRLLLHFVRKDGFTDEISITDFSLVGTSASQQPSGGTTIQGTFNATALTNVLNTQNPAVPFVKLRLAFANTAVNREWFSKENVKDILLMVSCKAELPAYPL